MISMFREREREKLNLAAIEALQDSSDLVYWNVFFDDEALTIPDLCCCSKVSDTSRNRNDRSDTLNSVLQGTCRN